MIFLYIKKIDERETLSLSLSWQKFFVERRSKRKRNPLLSYSLFLLLIFLSSHSSFFSSPPRLPSPLFSHACVHAWVRGRKFSPPLFISSHAHPYRGGRDPLYLLQILPFPSRSLSRMCMRELVKGRALKNNFPCSPSLSFSLSREGRKFSVAKRGAPSSLLREKRLCVLSLSPVSSSNSLSPTSLASLLLHVERHASNLTPFRLYLFLIFLSLSSPP